MNRLKDLKLIDTKINEKLQEIERLRAMANKVSVTLDSDPVKTSKTYDRIPKIVAEMVDLEREVNADIDAFFDLKKHLMKQIDQLSDPLLIKILYRRYFQYQTLEALADELEVSRQWVSHKLKEFWDSCL